MSITRHELRGTLPAIVTPFSADGQEVDYPSLENLIEFLIAGGVQGVVVCGSTGEAATLSDDEYREVISATAKIVKRRVTLIAGIGANSTARAVEISRFLESSGVDGVMVVAPAYNKPPQSGILAHFREIKKACALPLIAYNVPGRTAVNILPRTVAKLAEEGVIIGIKEASGSLDQVLDLLALTGEMISILSGEDALTQVIIAAGGSGVISVTANLLPGAFVRITSAALKGEMSQSADAQLRVLPAIRAMFAETNPIPLKTALAMKGIIAHATLRLPLMPAEASTVEKIKAIL